MILVWVAVELLAYGLLVDAARAASDDRLVAAACRSALALGCAIALACGSATLMVAGLVAVGFAEVATAWFVFCLLTRPDSGFRY